MFKKNVFQFVGILSVFIPFSVDFVLLWVSLTLRGSVATVVKLLGRQLPSGLHFRCFFFFYIYYFSFVFLCFSLFSQVSNDDTN